MAKITCEFDTVEKTLSVMMNDKKVKDVSEANFITHYDDPSKGFCELRTAKFDDDDKTVTITRIMANEQGEMVEEKMESKTLSKEDGEKLEATAASLIDISRALFPRKDI